MLIALGAVELEIPVDMGANEVSANAVTTHFIYSMDSGKRIKVGVGEQFRVYNP